MAQLSPRTQKILNVYKVIFLLTTIIVPTLVYLLVPGSGIFWWLIATPFCYLAISKIPRGLLHLVLYLFYRDEIQDITRETNEELKRINAEENEPEEDDDGIRFYTIIKTAETPIARFMDCDIWDWVTLEDENGNTFKGTYVSAFKFKPGQEDQIPEGCVVFDPGIMYRITVIAG